MHERKVGPLTFRLDLSQPLYEQILEQMRAAIARGELPLGEKIPSVREMAQALRVNPNTVSHAYQELERDGLTETRRGQGTFVTAEPARVDQFRTAIAEQAVNEFVDRMQALGFGWNDIDRLLDERKAKGGA
ncbi:MAG: GntR family transcriptional regulator [Alicyclobacillaceae bacterium]|nr:GntR family transcriptional regulator [Alicyclobacillaceae bacterium]